MGAGRPAPGTPPAVSRGCRARSRRACRPGPAGRSRTGRTHARRGRAGRGRAGRDRMQRSPLHPRRRDRVPRARAVRPGAQCGEDYAPAVMDSVGAGTFGKPLLVELSHMIEQFALAAEPGVPTVVIAMFQRLAYFSREAQVYREIAARGAVPVVGMVDDAP